jgi:DNA-binding transcriptional LysR family regulator
MKLTLEALEVIDTIERRGSYAAAAEALHKVPSAVSYIVHKLETDLNLTIFDRAGHRAKLTNAGRVLLERGRQLLRDAEDLQCRASRVNMGWETELRIAIDTVVPIAGIVSYATAFYGEHSATRLQFLNEALGGTWDALYTRRADLVVGAMGEPPFIGHSLREIDTLEIGFYLAPSHPLASAHEPLSTLEVSKYRAVAIQDTSRQLPSRMINLGQGQDTTIVATMDAKLQFLLAGLGVGYLPVCVARPYVEKGLLMAKRLDTMLCPQIFHLAWHSDDPGEGLRWWIRQLDRRILICSLWASIQV